MELDLAAKELSLKREDIRPLELISIIIIKLLPIEQVIYQMLELDQLTPQRIQYDEILSFKIKISKCHEIVALGSNTVMLIHHHYDYSVIRLKKQKCQIITFGKLCGLCQNIRKFDRTQIIYVFDEAIHIYDWISKEIVNIFTFQSTLSPIYLKIANYWMDDQYLLIWRQSSLKLQYQYYYQIELYSRNGMVLAKKWRIQKSCAQDIALLRNPTPLPILCPTQGYNLVISIPDLNLAHQIKSIYKLLLTQLIPHPYDRSQVQLNFTHNQLIAGTRLCYHVSTDAIRKTYKQLQQAEDEDFVSWQKFQEGDARYEIGVKDWVGSYSERDGVEIKLKARYGRKVKMCAMLECVMESEVGKLSTDLLMQMCSMIQ